MNIITKKIIENKKILSLVSLVIFLVAVAMAGAGAMIFYYFKYGAVSQNEEPKTENTSTFIIPEINREMVVWKINEGKEFLLRAENKETGGFYKMYDVLKDDFGKQVHTVYSASIVYTFLKIYEFDKDQRIQDNIGKWADFLLSMQNQDKKDKRYGAFSYSYDLEKKEKEKKYVVGTSALNILTLLKLYESNTDQRYLEASKLAGDWLITMQEEDGGMKQYARYDESKQKWVFATKESFLYDGQVLTALSRLYKKTGEKKYYNSAEKIAKRLAELYEEKRGYIVDEVRTENPISNSWVVMSLTEFYKNANPNKRYKDIVFELAEKIAKNQKTNSKNLLNQGMWNGAYSTSGVGWISEVMTEIYQFCLEEKTGDCEKYKNAAISATRWLMQNTYSKDNNPSYLKNPAMANGGIYWNSKNLYVRTDSNCHGLNSYIGIVNEIE
ncbi:MAG: hypothetical protein AAB361_02430 [Patescibacteria group bacterium]